jgi:hypothetical protein
MDTLSNTLPLQIYQWSLKPTLLHNPIHLLNLGLPKALHTTQLLWLQTWPLTDSYNGTQIASGQLRCVIMDLLMTQLPTSALLAQGHVQSALSQIQIIARVA